MACPLCPGDPRYADQILYVNQPVQAGHAALMGTQAMLISWEKCTSAPLQLPPVPASLRGPVYPSWATKGMHSSVERPRSTLERRRSRLERRRSRLERSRSRLERRCSRLERDRSRLERGRSQPEQLRKASVY